MLRDHLRDFVKSRDNHQQWTGYKAFVRYGRSAGVSRPSTL